MKNTEKAKRAVKKYRTAAPKRKSAVTDLKQELKNAFAEGYEVAVSKAIAELQKVVDAAGKWFNKKGTTKKTTTKTSASAGKKRGRPRKNAAEAHAEAGAKKRRGRPPKHKGE